MSIKCAAFILLLLWQALPARAAVMQPPPEPPAPSAMPPSQSQPAMQYQCLDPTSRLHALLKKYALKCGNPACPVCYPGSPP